MRLQPAFPEQLDTRITDMVRSWWGYSTVFDTCMVVIAQWTPIIMLIIIAIASMGTLLEPQFHQLALSSAGTSVVAAFLGRILNEPLSRMVARPRPFEQGQFQPLLAHEHGDSFPSNHACGAFALAIGCLHVPGYHEVLLLSAVSLAVSRVYCGLHYTTDVVFGVLNGIFIATVCLYCMQRLLQLLPHIFFINVTL